MSANLDPIRADATTTAGVAVAFALVAVASGGTVVLPVVPPLDLAVGLAVPLALVLGPVAVLGVAVGSLLTAVLRFAVSWGAILDAVAWTVLAAVAYRLWGVLPAVSSGEAPTLDVGEQWLEFAVVATVAAISAVGVLAWGSLVVLGGEFHAVVLAELPIVLVSTAVVGPVVLGVAASLGDDGRLDDADRYVDLDDLYADYDDRRPIAIGSGAFRGAVLAPILWVALASLASLTLSVVHRIGGATFRRHGYGRAFEPIDPAIVGHAGRRVQILLGAAVLALALAAYVPLPWTDGDDRSSTCGNDSSSTRDDHRSSARGPDRSSTRGDGTSSTRGPDGSSSRDPDRSSTRGESGASDGDTRSSADGRQSNTTSPEL